MRDERPPPRTIANRRPDTFLAACEGWQDVELRDLERFYPGRSRYRGFFLTQNLAAFSAFVLARVGEGAAVPVFQPGWVWASNTSGAVTAGSALAGAMVASQAPPVPAVVKAL